MNVNRWQDGEKTRGGYRRPRRETVVRDQMGRVVSTQAMKDSVGHGKEFLDFILRAARIYWRSLSRGLLWSY